MNQITYHKATKKDIRTLVDSRVDFLTEYWGKQQESAEKTLRAELEKFFSASIPEESYICWIAFVDSEFAGIGGMSITKRPGSFRIPDGQMAYIMNMYTVPQYRKKGIGSGILQKLIDSGKELGIKLFELHATPDGEPVYIKGGFELHQEPTYRRFMLNN